MSSRHIDIDQLIQESLDDEKEIERKIGSRCLCNWCDECKRYQNDWEDENRINVGNLK